jgi:hypothetical protein
MIDVFRTALRTELLVLAVAACACSGAVAAAADAGHDDASDGAYMTSDAELDAAFGDATDGGAALSEAADKYCAGELDASDPGTVCSAKNCCAQMYLCAVGPACGEYASCIDNTPTDAAPADASFSTWLVAYCTSQFPEGGAQTIAIEECYGTYCGDAGP